MFRCTLAVCQILHSSHVKWFLCAAFRLAPNDREQGTESFKVVAAVSQFLLILLIFNFLLYCRCVLRPEKYLLTICLLNHNGGAILSCHLVLMSTLFCSHGTSSILRLFSSLLYSFFFKKRSLWALLTMIWTQAFWNILRYRRSCLCTWYRKRSPCMYSCRRARTLSNFGTKEGFFKAIVRKTDQLRLLHNIPITFKMTIFLRFSTLSWQIYYCEIYRCNVGVLMSLKSVDASRIFWCSQKPMLLNFRFQFRNFISFESKPFLEYCL